MYTTDAARWRALSVRDPNANNHFVYTVKSTHVYCRPVCPARLARRANVGFCTTPAEAAALGFRACKRCKPDVAQTDDPQEKAVTKACELIEEALKVGDVKAVKLQDLAKKVGLTPRYFHKIFKEKTGLTPKEWTQSKTVGKEGGEKTPSLVMEESSPDLSSFGLDAFDFNELVDPDMGFDAAEGFGMGEPSMLPLDGFGDIFGADSTIMLTWDTFAPDYLDSGFRLTSDTITQWAEADVNPNATVTKTSATFEQDAALILTAGLALESGGMCVNTAG